MTAEERLDRLERIAKLMVRAGLRARRQMREQDNKINMLIDAQMKNEELFSQRKREQDEKINALIEAQMKNEERFARTDERFARTDEQVAALAESQAKTDRQLEALIEVVKAGRDGNSHWTGSSPEVSLITTGCL
jgi:hypothetical protein